MAQPNKGKGKANKLSTLGAKVEALLLALMADMEKDVRDTKDGAGRRYTLVDQMRVIDRANKLEGIKAKIEDDGEGSFFDNDEGAGDET